MRARHLTWFFAAALIGVAGCGGGDGDDGGPAGRDGGGPPPGVDGGPTPGMDAGPGGGTDAGPGGGTDGGSDGSDAGPPPWDSGPPMACETPGALETVSCGRCGSVERFCTSGGTWAYGACEGQGGCMPGTTMSLTCGNCGTQAARCTDTCEWEATEACSGEGECAPGVRSRSGAGCGAGQTREVLCSDACSYEPAGTCEDDGCDTPGALETVACGMCGTQDRFCTAGGVWEYGACSGEGVCMPGTTEDVACGMCGTRSRRCLSSCTWEDTGSCTGEGACAPGTTTRTTAGCPAGQSKPLTCSDACAYVESGPCEAVSAVDVTILLDMTGSNAMRVTDGETVLLTRLIDPLLALGDVAVGVSYYAEFPGDGGFPFPFDSGTGGGGGPGDAGDRPFHGGIEPTTSRSAIATELAGAPTYGGGDAPESGVEALSMLSGGPAPSSALALTCSSGRVAGGCWRGAATRVIVVYTDASNHEGPDPGSAGIYSPYGSGVSSHATWAGTESRLLSDGTRLVVMHHQGSDSVAGPQWDEMLSDLGQTGADRVNATTLGTGCDAAVARVRTLTGL